MHSLEIKVNDFLSTLPEEMSDERRALELKRFLEKEYRLIEGDNKYLKRTCFC